jgi:hypothetical protein
MLGFVDPKDISELGPAAPQSDRNTGINYEGGGIEIKVIDAQNKVKFLRHGISELKK